ncbi:MAG: DUF4416 family protein [candidate division WOR-3 bacterium]
MKPARLIIGILARHPDLINQVQPVLTQEFGPIIVKSPNLSWNFSRYYEDELGPDITRCWVCHSPLVAPDSLLAFKKRTITIENAFRDEQGRRTLNLDPGILTLHNLVLATTKDYAHRVCLGEGIYAEVTLIYHKGRFEPLLWTYPDYKTETCLTFLGTCRKLLLTNPKGLYSFSPE